MIINKMYGDVNIYKSVVDDLSFTANVSNNSDCKFTSKVILLSNSMFGNVNIIPPVIEKSSFNSKDTTLEEKIPTVSFYDFNTLTTGNGFTALIKFPELINLLSKNINIVSIKLKLHEVLLSDNVYKLYNVNKQWDDVNISWFTKPNKQEFISDFKKDKGNISVDLTKYYTDLKSSNELYRDYGFIIESDDIGVLSSNEGYTKPVLEVEYIDLSKQISLSSFKFNANINKLAFSDKQFNYQIEYPQGANKKSDNIFTFNIIKADSIFDVGINKYSDCKFSYKTHLNGVSTNKFGFNFIKPFNDFYSSIAKSSEQKFEYNLIGLKESNKAFETSIYHTKNKDINFSASISYNSFIKFESNVIKLKNSDKKFEFNIIKDCIVFDANFYKYSDKKFDYMTYTNTHNDNKFNYAINVNGKSEQYFTSRNGNSNDKIFECSIMKSDNRSINITAMIHKKYDIDKEFDCDLLKSHDNKFSVDIEKMSDKLFDYILRRDDEVKFEVNMSNNSDSKFECGVLIFGSSYKHFSSNIEYSSEKSFEYIIKAGNYSDCAFDASVVRKMQTQTDKKFNAVVAINKDVKFNYITAKANNKNFTMMRATMIDMPFEFLQSIIKDKPFECKIENSSQILFTCKLGEEKFDGYIFII